jgi:hypothetical protein
MPKHIYIEVPAKPIVAQYIHNRYGNPVVFPSGDWLRALTLNLLISANRNYDSTIKLTSYTINVKLPFTISEIERYGNTLTTTSIFAINNRIEDEIHQRLYIIFEYYHATIGFTIKQTAQKFQEIYNFPETIYSTDNILKQYQRHIRQELKKKNFSQSVLCPPYSDKRHPNATTKQAAQRISAMREVLERYPIII